MRKLFFSFLVIIAAMLLTLSLLGQDRCEEGTHRTIDDCVANGGQCVPEGSECPEGYAPVETHPGNPTCPRGDSCCVLIPVPKITSNPPVNATVGKEYTYLPSATGMSPFTWALITAPFGMVIDTNTGLISWVPGYNPTKVQKLSQKFKTVRNQF